jgi:hypothetical protein
MEELEILQLKIDELTKANLELTEENSQLKLSIAELKAAEIPEISTEKTPVLPTEPISIGGKNYLWKVAAFRGQGGEIVSAEEASTDADLLASILEIEGQGILVEQA